MPFSVTSAGITLPGLPGDVKSVDVFFGEDRVWSLDLNVALPGLSGRFRWPVPIKPFLEGSTTVVLRNSADGSEIARTRAVFSDASVTTRVLDDEGIPLTINKWGRLGKTLGASNPGVQERILDRTEELIEQLKMLGLRPFVVGGTLLGGVRDGTLLPHDDDADIAYLSEHTNPADVAHEGFEIGHQLQALGYELVRHSATHMQLYFRNASGHLDHYIDIFSAFFTDDGYINQPFHVRGEMHPDQMLPFSSVTISGREFPAPADSERWLVINYDENWRTPIPGYRLETPRPTIRRFRNWFGSFHFKRDFWNDRYHEQGEEADRPWRSGAEWIIAHDHVLTSPWLLDLGCGSGFLSGALQRGHSDRRVIACDYSPSALAVAGRAGTRDGFATAHINLYRIVSLGLPANEGVDSAFDIVANHVIDSLGSKALPNMFRLIRMALRSGGSALATVYGAPNLSGDPSDPTTWALEPTALASQARQFGLNVKSSSRHALEHETSRAPYGAVFTLNTDRKEESQ